MIDEYETYISTPIAPGLDTTAKWKKPGYEEEVKKRQRAELKMIEKIERKEDRRRENSMRKKSKTAGA